MYNVKENKDNSKTYTEDKYIYSDDTDINDDKNNILKFDISTNEFSSLVYELSKIDKQLELDDRINVSIDFYNGIVYANTYCDRKKEFKGKF